MIQKIRTYYPHLLFLILLLVAAVTYYGGIIHRLPFGIHAWAQADRLALAYNFYDHGMNFLRPASNSLYSDFGIVGVEFPIQSYLAAALGMIFGRESINSCFRLLDIVLACTGLYFLFLTVYKRSGHFLFSIFPPLFFFCSPVYIYYSGNYQPDAASVSICFIACYYLFNYLDHKRSRSLIATIVILTLAVLVKTSTVHYLLGVMAYGLYDQFRRKAPFMKVIRIGMVYAASVAILVINYIHIQYLNTHFHSTLFLSKINPFTRWQDVTDYFDQGFKGRWMDDYLMLAQYPVYVSIVAVGLYIAAKNRKNRGAFLVMGIFLAGSLGITALFGMQLMIHDYYILPIFFPLLAFVFVFCTLSLREAMPENAKKPVKIYLISTMLLLFFLSDYQTHQRLSMIGNYYEGEDARSLWMENGNLLMKELGIAAQEPIVVVDEAAPNLALVHFDRRGYHMPNNLWQHDINVLEKFMREKKVRILVGKEQVIKDVIAGNAPALSHFKTLAIKDNKAVLELLNP